jgi:1-acyl-sn-glycerol-3-phosphate acyltransferase
MEVAGQTRRRTRSQATIIPMFVHGARDVMPRDEWRVRPGHIRVHLLEAMPTRGLTYEDRSAVLERLRALAEHEISQRPGRQAVHATPSR